MSDLIPSSYRALIRERIASRSAEPVYNSSSSHAAVIHEEAFLAANSQIRLLVKNLNRDCFWQRSLINAARLFVGDPTHTLTILIERPRFSESQMDDDAFLSEVMFEDATGHKSVRKNVLIKHVPEDVQAHYEYNMMIMDDYGYRFESDRTQHMATAVWGDVDTTSRLMAAFDSIAERSTVIHPRLQQHNHN